MLRSALSPLDRGLRVAIAVVSLGGGLAIAPLAATAQTVGGGDSGGYPPNFEQEFTEGCLLNAIRAGGLSPETAERYCGCAVNTLQNRYSFEQAIALYEQVGQSQNGQLPAELDDIARTCLGEVVEGGNGDPTNQP